MRLKQIMNNFQVVEHKHFHVYFSYETPIAYQVRHQDYITVAENEWSRTTGKHINWIKREFPDHHEVVPFAKLRENLDVLI